MTDGSMYITYKGKLLRYKEINTMSIRVAEPPIPKDPNREEDKTFCRPPLV